MISVVVDTYQGHHGCMICGGEANFRAGVPDYRIFLCASCAAKLKAALPNLPPPVSHEAEARRLHRNALEQLESMPPLTWADGLQAALKVQRTLEELTAHLEALKETKLTFTYTSEPRCYICGAVRGLCQHATDYESAQARG